MTNLGLVCTRYEWLATLARLSPVIARVKLERVVEDYVYWDSDRKRARNALAFNLANSDCHNELIARCLERLDEKSNGDVSLRKLLVDLTSGNTYGAFCEISVYSWLLDLKIHFELQVSMAKVLNPNGSILDGRLGFSSGVLFDVKGFGFHEQLVKRLQGRLSEDFVDSFVAIEGTWDVPISELADLLSSGYQRLKRELAQAGYARRGSLDLILRSKSPVQVTSALMDPYLLAETNSGYAFNYAKQFARRESFLLVFVIHPWVSGVTLHDNFANYVGTFTRALARRTFMQFRRDRTPLMGTTRARASRLLSGLAFLNAWRDPNEQGPMTCRLFLNPHAKYPISALVVDELRWSVGNSITVDRFDHDTY